MLAPMHIAPNPDPVPRLWAAARAMYERMRAALGDAKAIAQRILVGDELVRARAWLRALEALVRQIVLADALAIAQTPRAPAPPPLHMPRWVVVVAEKPEPKPSAHARRGAFCLWPRPKPGPRIRLLADQPRSAWEVERDAREAARLARMTQARGVPDCIRIARRIEGVARIMAKPYAAARRLAAKLRVDRHVVKSIIGRRMPRTAYLDTVAYGAAFDLSFRRARALYAAADTS